MDNRWVANLTLDVATSTGWCLWHSPGQDQAPVIRCGSWRNEGEDPFAKACALGDHLQRMLLQLESAGGRLGHAAIEAPMGRVPTKKVATAAGETFDVLDGQFKTMAQLTGMAVGAGVFLHLWNVTFDVIEPSTWRKTALGYGRAPKGKSTKWLKDEMKFKAEMLGDKFGFTVPNHDASDAVGLAVHLATLKGLYHPRIAFRPGLFDTFGRPTGPHPLTALNFNPPVKRKAPQ